MNSQVKVAIASNFLNAFAKIPGKQQNKVLEFITKFRSNPMAPGINYEKIATFKDQTLRSVRIDKTYRGIVKKSDSGNIFMLLWVDHHDKAYKWAENKVCEINPETGCLQIYEVEEQPDDRVEPAGATQTETKPDKDEKIFSSIRDRHLLKLGVPADQLSLVRSFTTMDQLDAAAERLPSEVYEALFFLGEGYSLEEVFREMGKSEGGPEVNIDDFEKALENPDSKRHFFVVEDDLILQEILKAPLEKWRVFLHPSQRNLVEREWNGPVRVLGGAGTGKTVVAIHRAKYLAENIFTKDQDRILFTTFTRNLAADILENLKKICPDNIMRRIEVINLDRWVLAFLKKNDYNYSIDYGANTSPLWEKALSLVDSELGFADSFFREEWRRVVQPNGITSFSEYAKISRLGRGVQLSRKKRKVIWPVFEEYRVLLNENHLREPDDAMRDAWVLMKKRGNVLPYRAVIVDEAQDMGSQAFRLIRQIVSGGEQKNDIFIVGDAHQRIYRHKVVLGQCGINIKGRGRKLRINYRTTDENRRWAVNLLKGVNFDDLDGEPDDQKGYKSLLHGMVPIIKICSSFQQELDVIIDYLDKVEKSDGDINGVCLVARTNNLLKQYEGALKAKGKDTCLIRRSEAEDHREKGVRLATMHRVKGLEFDRVIIAGVNDGVVPLEAGWNQSTDQVILKETETHERALLYVAATRAKKGVLVTSFGKASRFLQ
ncbi:MAG: UvrD-helicase domain-containing protein [Pseudomonadota bacterium]|nr:UvrD-helicase domain-containing protein [Pseudomonadota bacterium]